MATVEECNSAIIKLAGRLGGAGGGRTSGLDRSVSATITDLGVRFRGHLHDGMLDDVRREDDDAAQADAVPAQIRMTMTSEDLLALADGELSLGSAWLAGRIKVHASLPDMLRLRAMM